MPQKISIAFFAFLAITVEWTSASETGSGSKPSTTDFPYHSVLDPNGAFQLFWKFDDETITFQYHAATKGWAGLGFSPNGGMANADIVVIWVDKSGKGFISDRHATKNGFPPEDAKQDYTLISAVRNDTHLISTFSRKRNTCDPDDWVLSDDTTRVIYAANDAIPENKDTIQYHTVRGSKSVHFFDRKVADEDEPPPEKDAKMFELRVNKVHVPENVATTYWCEVLVAPKMPAKKSQIIKIAPAIQPENLDVVHHIVIYICSKNMSHWLGKGRSCFNTSEDDEVTDFSECKQQVLAVWAVGGQAASYPDDVGMPLYAEDGDMYVMMEMHYDNSNFKKGKIDSSGMQVWVTEKLRPIDAGSAVFGIPVKADEQVIPPGVKEWTNYAYCTPECTSNFPKEGIRVTGGLLHTHLAGRKVRVTHFRNGKQLPPVIADEYYDFNYQDNRKLTEPIIILPNDQIVLQCVYSTEDRNKTTFSGHGTHDEMCIAFLVYYPAISSGFGCFSSPVKRDLYKMFGINFVPFNSSNPTDNNIIQPNGEKKLLQNYLKEDFDFKWTPEKAEQFQKAVRSVKHNVICLREDLDEHGMNFTKTENGTIKGIFTQNGYPNITEPLAIHDVCTEKKGKESTKNGGTEEKEGSRPVSEQLRERNSASSRYSHISLGMIVLFVILCLITH